MPLQKILLKDFSDWAQSLTGRLRRSCEDVAEGLGIRREYLRRSGVDKEALARAIVAEEGIEEGPICMLSTVEPSLSPTVVKNRESKRLKLAMRLRKCVWVYFYFNDPVVGFGHVRIESWLPFTIKGCLNGRHWLERSLMREEGEYIKQGNCFRWLADPLRAQELADNQLHTDWPGLLNGFATTYFPVMGELLDHMSLRYLAKISGEAALSRRVAGGPSVAPRRHLRETPDRGQLGQDVQQGGQCSAGRNHHSPHARVQDVPLSQ